MPRYLEAFLRRVPPWVPAVQRLETAVSAVAVPGSGRRRGARYRRIAPLPLGGGGATR